MKGFLDLGRLLGPVLDQAGLAHVLLESRLRGNWTEVMGERAAKIAKLVSLKEGKLRVEVENAAWRQELHFEREVLRERANRALGRDYVKDVILL